MRARDLRITKANCPVVDVDVVDFAEQTVQNRAISNLELFIEPTQLSSTVLIFQSPILTEP